MKKKIYNRKAFLSGIIFLLLAAINIPLFIVKFDSYNILGNIKSILVDIFCLLFGLTAIYRSLDSKCAKEDAQNDDERQELITLKSKSSAYTISFIIFTAITILILAAFGLTKNNNLIGILVGIGITPTFMIIAEIICYIYHDRYN